MTKIDLSSEKIEEDIRFIERLLRTKLFDNEKVFVTNMLNHKYNHKFICYQFLKYKGVDDSIARKYWPY